MKNCIKIIFIIIFITLFIVSLFFNILAFSKNKKNNFNDILCNADTIEDIYKLKEKDKPLMIFIGADYCNTCINYKAYIKEFYEQYNSKITIKYVDAEKCKNIRKEYNVEIIPTTIIYDSNGEFYNASEKIVLFENNESIDEKRYQSDDSIIISGENLGLNTNFEYGQDRKGRIIYSKHTGIIDLVQLKDIAEELIKKE